MEAPTVPVKLKNPTDINANDFLLELQKVQEAILAEFNQRGWAYSIDFDRVAQFAEELNVSCIGVTDYAAKSIYVSEASATVHEFGHFLDKVLGFPAEHERLFCEEAESSILRDYAKTNAHEYFADCFVYWIMYNESAKRMERFKQSAPQTYAYFADTKELLDFWEIDPKYKNNSLYMLAMTQGKMQTDSFEFLASFMPANGVCFVTDIAGINYRNFDLGKIKEGTILSFEQEPNNSIDNKAVKVLYKGELIGYIKRGHNEFFYGENSDRIKLCVKSITNIPSYKELYVKVYT